MGSECCLCPEQVNQTAGVALSERQVKQGLQTQTSKDSALKLKSLD